MSVNDIFFQKLTLANLDALHVLDTACFEYPWTRQQLEEELSHHHAHIFGCFQDQKLIAAACVRFIGDAYWLMRIMVLPVFRGQSIASKILANVYCDIGEKELWLEVASQNRSAIYLYTKEGFEIVHTRKKYYPNDDALVMVRK